MVHIKLNLEELEGDYDYFQMSPGATLDFIEDIIDSLLKHSFPGIRELRHEVRYQTYSGDIIFALPREQVDELDFMGIDIPETSEETLETVAMYAVELMVEAQDAQS